MEKTEHLTTNNVPVPVAEKYQSPTGYLKIDLLFRQIEESPDADSALIPMALEELGRLRDQLNDKQQKRLDNIIIKRDMYLETQAKTVQMN